MVKHGSLSWVLIGLALVAAGLEPPTAWAQAPAELVRDINPGAGSADPGLAADINGTLFFSACAGSPDPSGRGTDCELWRSSGTAAETVLVKDINPGSIGSDPGELRNVDGTLVFSACAESVGDDGSPTNCELWKSDGTASGTVLVKDINPGRGSSFLGGFASVNGALLFRACAGPGDLEDCELWKSDGTADGTVLVKDIHPGSGSSFPGGLINVSGTWFFSACDSESQTGGATNCELWKGDGTADGTVRVKDINPGSGSSYPSGLTNVAGILFFRACDGPPDKYGSPTDCELWKSAGTAEGTVRVKDINPGSGSSNPGEATNVAGTLFFSACAGPPDALGNGTDCELWKSDGTADGTVRVKDINPGSADSGPWNLTNVGGTLFFTAYNGASGSELWKSDGTTTGTVLVNDINPGSASANPSRLLNANGTVFFRACAGLPDPSGSGTDCELWSSDGTASGTVRVVDLWPGSGSSSPANLMQLGRDLLFAADRPETGRELWRLPDVVPLNPCVGSCNGDGRVTADELVMVINIALGHTSAAACTAGDANHDGRITIDEIVTAVTGALDGCG